MESEASVLGKRSRKEVVAARRQHEQDTFRQLVDELPFGTIDLLKTTQATVLQIALSYVKLRNLLKSANASFGLASLLTEEELGFKGFLLMVDHTGSILHASRNFTSSLGPTLVDTIGRSITDLLHPEDAQQLEGALNWRSVGNQQMFVVRMKTNMTPTIRSPSKVEYKNVFVICHLKNFSKMPLGRAAAEHSDSVAAVLLCRTEDLIGFPEIVMGGYIDGIFHKKTGFLSSLDQKTPWLLGYRCEDLNGKDYSILDHPHDAQVLKEYHEKNSQWIHETFHREGHLRILNSRIMTAWGQWIWVAREITAKSSTCGHPVVCNSRMYILGPDDSHIARPPPSSYLPGNMRGGESIDMGPCLDLDVLKFLDDYIQQTNLLEQTDVKMENGLSWESDVGYQSVTSAGSTNGLDDVFTSSSDGSPSMGGSPCSAFGTGTEWTNGYPNSSTSISQSVEPVS